MTSREFRLLAVAVVGLALVFVARAGEGDQGSVGVEGADDSPDVAVVADSDDAPDVPLTEDGDSLAGQLETVMGEHGIRLVDFGQVPQAPELCSEGIDAEELVSLPAIELTEGVSDSLDSLNLSHLEVLGEVYGDISGDGADEALVHTVCQYGASGRQHEVQVWQAVDSVPMPVAVVPEPGAEVTGPLSPDVSDVEVDDGRLLVTWTRYAEGDPNCCPSGEVTLAYQLDGSGGLVTLGD